MNDQRRQFFRIQDEGIVHLEIVKQENLEQVKKDIYDQSYQDDVFKRFFKFESELQSILFNNKSLSADWINVVDLLNVKINQLARLLAVNYQTIFNHPAQPINLSANGLGIDSQVAYMEGELVRVELILLPQYTFISALCRVVYCDKKDQKGSIVYSTGLQIEIIRPQDTDRLIQHIMRKEAEWLKHRREQSLNESNRSLNK